MSENVICESPIIRNSLLKSENLTGLESMDQLILRPNSGFEGMTPQRAIEFYNGYIECDSVKDYLLSQGIDIAAGHFGKRLPDVVVTLPLDCPVCHRNVFTRTISTKTEFTFGSRTNYKCASPNCSGGLTQEGEHQGCDCTKCAEKSRQWHLQWEANRLKVEPEELEQAGFKAVREITDKEQIHNLTQTNIKIRRQLTKARQVIELLEAIATDHLPLEKQPLLTQLVNGTIDVNEAERLLDVRPL